MGPPRAASGPGGGHEDLLSQDLDETVVGSELIGRRRYIALRCAGRRRLFSPFRATQGQAPFGPRRTGRGDAGSPESTWQPVAIVQAAVSMRYSVAGPVDSGWVAAGAATAPAPMSLSSAIRASACLTKTPERQSRVCPNPSGARNARKDAPGLLDARFELADEPVLVFEAELAREKGFGLRGEGREVALQGSGLRGGRFK